MSHIVQTDPNGNLLLTAEMLGQQQPISNQYTLEFQGEALLLRPIKPVPSSQQQTKGFLSARVEPVRSKILTSGGLPRNKNLASKRDLE